ncbi:MAG: hypothetical protein AMXMBFR58_07870 [Phycisphaerae bacterium]
MTESASWNFSRKRTSMKQVSRGWPHMETSIHRGRGHEPVMVQGRVRSAVVVNMGGWVVGGDWYEGAECAAYHKGKVSRCRGENSKGTKALRH